MSDDIELIMYHDFNNRISNLMINNQADIANKDSYSNSVLINELNNINELVDIVSYKIIYKTKY